MESQQLVAFDRLCRILDILRAECPWDRAQTIESLRYLTIEEVSELSEAILNQEPDEMRKELGDLFLHLVFYAKIASERQMFSLEDVLHGIGDKLISRHPHIALPDRNGCMQGGPQNPRPQWEKVKMHEGRRSVLEGVPPSLPTLVKSVRLQEKAAGVGFDYDSAEAAFEKVREEYNELQSALPQRSSSNSGSLNSEDTPKMFSQCSESEGSVEESHVEEEFGDLLFALVKWGGMLGINADTALARTNIKFQQRFVHVEDEARRQGRSVTELAPEEMIQFWNEAKS